MTDRSLRIAAIVLLSLCLGMMVTGIVLGFITSTVILPTGRVASPRWRLLRWTPVLSILLLTLNGLFVAADDPHEARSPLAIDANGSSA